MNNTCSTSEDKELCNRHFSVIVDLRICMVQHVIQEGLSQQCNSETFNNFISCNLQLG